MKFYPLTVTAQEKELLEAEYKNARKVGIISLGETSLFFQKKLRKYYIPYSEITRCFRRVMTVPARLCCGKGEFAIEHLVLYTGETEIAQIQLPGTKAARLLMDELKCKIPEAEFTCPQNKEDMGKETNV